MSKNSTSDGDKKIRNKKDLTEFFKNDKTALDLIKKEKIKTNDPEGLKRLVSTVNGV